MGALLVFPATRVVNPAPAAHTVEPAGTASAWRLVQTPSSAWYERRVGSMAVASVEERGTGWAHRVRPHTQSKPGRALAAGDLAEALVRADARLVALGYALDGPSALHVAHYGVTATSSTPEATPSAHGADLGDAFLALRDIPPAYLPNVTAMLRSMAGSLRDA
jgi:hypothetical protein